MSNYPNHSSSSQNTSINKYYSTSNTSSSSEEDDIDELVDEAVYYVAHDYVPQIYRTKFTRNRPGGREYYEREREIGHESLMRDYFGDNPTYPPYLFRRRFRMCKHIFLRLVDAAVARDEFFHQNKDATGRFGMSALQKYTAEMRMLAYGTAADSVDEYLRMSEDTTLTSLKKFCEVIIAEFGNIYLRRPTQEDLNKLLIKGEQRGFPGMIGSIDCMHWEWKKCPAWKGQYQGRSGKATLILEAVASHELWIWHAFFGMPGSCNDINVLHRSPVFDDVLEGRAPKAHFVVNGHQYDKAYYLTDGIYPQWATFIQSFTLPQTAKERKFQEKQEAFRKDVERAFGVLQARFAIIRKPSLVWDRFLLSKIMMACIIMHNMIVEDERDSYDGYQDPTEFVQDKSAKKPRKRTSKTGRRKRASRLAVEQEENFTYSRERIVDINIYLANKDDVQDKNTHLLLKSDLIEHIWQKYGYKDL